MRPFPIRLGARTRAIAAAATLGAITLVAPGPAHGVDQDLQVSATSGAPGDTIDVSSASCVADDTNDRALDVRLVSGVAPDLVLGGVGTGYDGDPATIVIPDWLDPDAPAQILATCQTYDFDTDTVTDFPMDPVDIDVLPGAGPVTQTATPSRTSLLAGQAFSVHGTGCDGADLAAVVVLSGADIPGGDYGDTVGEGIDLVESATFDVDTALNNASTEAAFSQEDGGPVTIDEVAEIPMDIPPGTYTAVPYCLTLGKNAIINLVLPSTTIEVTGAAPTGAVDLTVPANTRDVTLAGSECTTGDVSYELGGEDVRNVFGPDDPTDTTVPVTTVPLASARGAKPTAVAPPSPFGDHFAALRAKAGQRVVRHTARLIPGDDFVDGTVTPDGAGSWSVQDEVAFDVGLVDGYAMCGDPLAEGWLYDPQLAAVQVTPTIETTTTTTAPTTTTTTQPPATGAAPIAGTPTYAG